MSQNETLQTDEMVSISSNGPYMVSVYVAPEKTEKKKEDEKIRRSRLQMFLTELTALTYKYGFYLESETESDYSGGTYGYIEIGDINEAHKNYSYGYDSELNFADWTDGWWEKQVDWKKTIVGARNDTV